MAVQKGTDRLDKLVAAQTPYSRRDVHKLLSRGLVLVNGVPARNFDTRIDLARDAVTVDGKPLRLTRYSYIMLNKPRGVVSATSDAALPTVLDLLPPELRRGGLFPAGRLDKETEGFVLITNDGGLAHRILSPRSHVPKVYTARLDRPFTPEVRTAFAEGVRLKADKHDNSEGTVSCLPASLEAVGGDFTVARVTLRQGLYHQVRRMFAAFGITVVALRRDRIGGLALDPGLEPGKCRELSKIEVMRIECEGDEAPSQGGAPPG